MEESFLVKYKKYHSEKYGWLHQEYEDDYISGALSKSDYFELLDELWTIEEVGEKIDDVAGYVLFEINPDKEKLCGALLDYEESNS
jgi:hypothetical protein